MKEYIPLLCAIIGGLMYLLVKNLDWKELGRITFFAGLLAFLLLLK